MSECVVAALRLDMATGAPKAKPQRRRSQASSPTDPPNSSSSARMESALRLPEMSAAHQVSSRPKARAKAKRVVAPERAPLRLSRARADASLDAARMLDMAQDEAPLTALERAAVGEGTIAIYETLMPEFLRRTVKRSRFRASPVKLAQRLVMSHLATMFAERRACAEGNKFLAAVGHFHPELGRATRALPRARRMLQGWGRLQPTGTRVPPPHCAVAGVAVEMAKDGHIDMSIATLTAHQAYLRPEELHSLRKQDAVRPTGRSGAESAWSLLLGPIELRKPTKTGIFDDCVMLDHPELLWTTEHLARYKALGDQSDRLWPWTREAYEREFAIVVKRLGLSSWGLVPYSLRHSGPSWDRSMNRLSLAEVQRRGRWLDQRTVMRYEKSSRTSALLADLNPVFLRYLRRCESALQLFVEDPRQAPVLPSHAVGSSL